MSENLQEKEFNVFGLTKAMRQGFIATIMSALIFAVGYLYYDKSETDKRNQENADKRFDKLMEKVLPATDKMDKSSDKVNAMIDSIQATNNSNEENKDH